MDDRRAAYMEERSQAAEQVFAPDQRFLLLNNGCSICLGVAQEAIALSSCGKKALVYSTTQQPVMHSMAYLPSRLQLPCQQLLGFRNRFIGLLGQRVVLNERYMRCEFHKYTYDEPLERIEATAMVRRKRRCPFGRRAEMEVQYRFHPLNIAETGNIDMIACTTVTHSMPAEDPMAQFEALDTFELPAEEESDMSRVYEELEACKDFLVTYSRTRNPLYPWRVGTVVEVSNGTVFMARDDGKVEVWMRPKPGTEWGDVLVLEHGFVTCLTCTRNLVGPRSSDDTILDEMEQRECALDTLLLGHGFGVSASAATAALAKRMAAFQEALAAHQHSSIRPRRPQPTSPSARLAQSFAASSTGISTCIREYANAMGVFRALGDGCVLARFHNRTVVRFHVALGVFRIISSDGEELASTIEHPYPLTCEQVQSIEWFASWGFSSDEEVEAMHEKLRAMSAMVQTAVQRSSLFLSFLGKKGSAPKSPVTVTQSSQPQALSAPPAQINKAPSGQELLDLAARMVEHNQKFLDQGRRVVSDVCAK